MKGQTALEMTLLTAIIIVVAGMVYVSYSTEANDTIAETTMRTQIDMVLANSAFIDARCANTQLLYFNETTPGNYVIYLEPQECEQTLLTKERLEDIEGRISEALGCRYTDKGACRNKDYKLDLSSN